ncbi:DUF4381 domain-containing protein [Vibrio lamellibrachiae]|uniref:DUF4381 domain-containing protein n=1 Tax=Vibrio lamellibrachiae TaxID=2910253 RepID=UPI003D1464A6
MSNTNLEQGSVTEFGAHLIKNLEWAALPEPVSWMPATIGWYVLLMLLMLSLLGYGIFRRIKWLQEAYLRQAAELLGYYAKKQPQNIGHLVKRVAVQHWPKHNVGLMDAETFALFLEEQQWEAALSKSCCVALFNATYQTSETLSEQHIAEVEQWIGALNV